MYPDQHIIYALLDPRTGAPRYVGQSSRGLARPRGHALACNLRRDRSHKSAWIRSLVADGLSYVVLVLETVADRRELSAAERRWIAAGRAGGWDLVNHTDGGDGAGPRLDLVAMNRARTGKPGRVQSDAEIERRRTSMQGNSRARGFTHTPEARARIAAARRGKPTRGAFRPALRINLINGI